MLTTLYLALISPCLPQSDTDEEETCDAKMPSNDDDISTIDIRDELGDNEDKGPLRFLKDAWQEACDDVSFV